MGAIVMAYVCNLGAWISGAVLYEGLAQPVPHDSITITLPVFITCVFGCSVATWVVAANWFRRQSMVDDIRRRLEAQEIEIQELRRR